MNDKKQNHEAGNQDDQDHKSQVWPAELVERQEISGGTVEEKWIAFQSLVYKICEEKLGTAVRKHEDWFDGNSMEREELINYRNLARNNMHSKNLSLLRTDIEHVVNFTDSDEENSKINGGWQKLLNSRHLQTLKTLKVFAKA